MWQRKWGHPAVVSPLHDFGWRFVHLTYGGCAPDHHQWSPANDCASHDGAAHRGSTDNGCTDDHEPVDLDGPHHRADDLAPIDRRPHDPAADLGDHRILTDQRHDRGRPSLISGGYDDNE